MCDMMCKTVLLSKKAFNKTDALFDLTYTSSIHQIMFK